MTETPWCLILAALVLAPLLACAIGTESNQSSSDDARYRELREKLVAEKLAGRDITNQRVLDAMRAVPRHLFIPEALRKSAYQDSPLPIGQNQTISQPYVVALMTQLSRAAPGMKALDVGTGSGYQAAVLAEIVDEVFSIEILPELADKAGKRLAALGYDHVTVRCGDGYEGWPEEAPFDVIIVAAAPREVPQPLIAQLAPGGRLLIPVGQAHQDLVVIEKHEDGRVSRHTSGGVRFVPMTGKAEAEIR